MGFGAHLSELLLLGELPEEKVVVNFFFRGK